MYPALAYLLLGVGVASLLFSIVSFECVRRVREVRRAPASFPPISVLKPLKGADDELYENLASFARQDYPCFELVLGCEDVMDPALPVARRLKRAFPDVSITIVAGGDPVGYNPKVNNLVQLARAARYDWVLVSDADVLVDPDYLRDLAAETADSRVGLVSSVIAATGERSAGAMLDTLHLNGFVASSVCSAHVLAGHPCVVGKSMLFRKSILERLGGFDIVKDVLAEDYVLGQAFLGAGLRVALSGHPVRARSPERTVASFARRHLRWAQMRRHIAPALYAGELLLLPTPWLLAALVLALAPGLHSPHARPALALAALSALAVKVYVDGELTRILRGSSLSPKALALVPLKDLTCVGVWLLSWVVTTIDWRGNVLRIGPNSALAPAQLAEEGARRRAH